MVYIRRVPRPTSKRPKGTPTYPLERVKALALNPQTCVITEWAASKAEASFGLTKTQVRAKVQDLQPKDFYKPMPSKKRPGTMQDVYKYTITCDMFPRGIEVYCKVQVEDDKILIVISFKSEDGPV